MAIFEITSEAQFKKRVLQAEGPVLLELGAIWCEGCQYLKKNVFPGLNADASGDLTIASVNLKSSGKVNAGQSDEEKREDEGKKTGDVLHWKTRAGSDEKSPSPYMTAIPILVLFQNGKEVARLDYHYLEKHNVTGWNKEIIEKWLGEHGVKLSPQASLEHDDVVKLAGTLRDNKLETGNPQHEVVAMQQVLAAQGTTAGLPTNVSKKQAPVEPPIRTA